MKKHFFIAGLVMLLGGPTLPAHAQSGAKPISTAPHVTLDAATVYLRGAQLQGTVTLDLPAGDSEWRLQNVSGGLDVDSLALSTRSAVVVLASTFTPSMEEDDSAWTPDVRKTREQLDAAMAHTAQIEARQVVIEEQLALLKYNYRDGEKIAAIPAADVGRMVSLLDTTMQQALVERAANVQKLERARTEQARVQRLFDEAKAKGFQRAGTLLLSLHAAQPTRATFKVSYWVNDAGWVPSYDLQVGRVDEPVRLIQKARIFQNTGIAWNSVRLTLSSGNPARGAQAPTLQPWRIGVTEPESDARSRLGYAAAAMAPPPAAEYSDMAMKEARPTLDGYLHTDAGGLNVQYAISLPYTVPSDGKGHMVMLTSSDLPATYRHIAMPKLEGDAFLQAQVRDWDRLNLLPGTSNIFHDGTYVGQGRIDVRQGGETLDVSLGRDPRILVTRKETSDRRTANGNRQHFAYTITARNTRPEAVDLVIVDQVPVSSDNRLRVDDLHYGDARFNPQDGRVEWTLRLAPGEQRELPLSYDVTYPRNMDVWGI